MRESPRQNLERARLLRIVNQDRSRRFIQAHDGDGVREFLSLQGEDEGDIAPRISSSEENRSRSVPDFQKSAVSRNASRNRFSS